MTVLAGRSRRGRPRCAWWRRGARPAGTARTTRSQSGPCHTPFRAAAFQSRPDDRTLRPSRHDGSQEPVEARRLRWLSEPDSSGPPSRRDSPVRRGIVTSRSARTRGTAVVQSAHGFRRLWRCDDLWRAAFYRCGGHAAWPDVVHKAAVAGRCRSARSPGPGGSDLWAYAACGRYRRGDMRAGRLDGVPNDGRCGPPGGCSPAAIHRSQLPGGGGHGLPPGARPPPWARG